MKNLYVVRHCKAEGQAPDAPLTAVGVEQADRLAEFLSDKSIDAIVSSPYERARRTIAPLAARIGVEIVPDERLAERVLTDRDSPDWYEKLSKTFDDLDLCYEGGESSNAAMSRAVSAIQDALSSGHSSIVAVSHGNLIALLLKHFDSGMGMKEWEALSNPDVFHLAFAGDKPKIQRIWAD
ncbi:histidine phosphatase family protein [Paenibacillus silvisoli]|uniref:histidine phosphatase family protein n=1 Tax=Paenibacillus silvisoli TaxID=3110539 RepID=UPI002806319F|nr:histidine phosphatase family protein [Paenibacillus silvisoli]